MTPFDIPNPVYLLSLYNEQIREQKLQLHLWQVKLLLAFARDRAKGQVLRHVLCANNGSGKSQYGIAPCATWLGMRFVRARSIVTSSSGVQLDRQTGRAITHICEQVNKLMGDEVWRIKYREYLNLKTGSLIELFATDNPGLAEGYHCLDGGEEFAIFVDEAKTVDESIFEALTRCNDFTRRLDVSSPGKPSGHFYNVFTEAEGFWWKQKVTYHDCPHIIEDNVKAVKALYGEFSPIFRSNYLAEFTSVDEQLVMSYEAINRAFQRKLAA